MHQIEEQLLVDFATHRVITAIKIVETKQGRFNLVVTISWKDDECILANARHQPRAWANLHTLIRFIKNLHIPSRVPINLVLYEEKA